MGNHPGWHPVTTATNFMNRHITLGSIKVEAWCVCGNQSVEVDFKIHENRRMKPGDTKRIISSVAKAVGEAIMDNSQNTKRGQVCCHMDRTYPHGTAGYIMRESNKKIF